MIQDVVSNSQIKTFKRCRRKYWLAYVRRLRKQRHEYTGARQLGTRVHGALQVFYDVSEDWGSGLSRAITYLEQLRDQELGELHELDGETAEKVLKEHDLAVAMMEGYANWVAEEGVDAFLQPIAAEQLVRVSSPLPGVDLIGKLDLIVENTENGAQGFIDHKTVGDLQSPLKHLGMDEQFRMYALMQRIVAAQEGRAPVSFQIYNMLKRSKRTARANPPFFSRYEVYINDEELRSMWERLYGELTEISRFEDAISTHPELHRSIAYPSPTTDCSWDCDFYLVCPMFDDSRSDPEFILDSNFEVGDPHAHYQGQLTTNADVQQ